MKSALSAITFGIAALGAVSAHAQVATQIVNIGHVAPFSGPQAHYGKDTLNAANMAVDDLNDQKIVINGKRIEFKLLAEDDMADPKQGTAAAQKLCDSKVVGVVGHVNSGSAIPASQVYAACGIPFLTSGATNPKLTQMGFKTTYRMLSNDNALAAGVAIYAAQTLKIKRVAVVDDRTAYGQGVGDVFKREAKAAGIEIVAEEFTNDKATDFMSILTSIKSKNVQAIFFGGTDAQGGPMLRQLVQLGMGGVRLMGGDGICTTQLGNLAAGAPSLSNVICAEGGSSIAKMPGGTAWKARYDKRFPREYALFSPYTYDGVMVLVDAMKRANSTDPAVFGPKVAQTDYRGVTTTVRFDGNGELKSPAITLYTFKNGAKDPLN